ncbi:helix-turn-helix transcriptional regulator [Nocardia rhizosphaerihabitans]|uniref:helix-turn-helix transcriptional regulator n=1 Tax=Nocardia rhizosphaerihabitans TaxID=1691570 RepID=UPI003673374D
MDSRPLATPREVAAYTGLTEPALAQLRYLGRGPKFLKITGRHVRYRWEDIEAWLESSTRQSTGVA